MTSYRRMRRHTRQARRAGMQPMLVIDSDGQLPEIVAVVAARFVWRYRSELAPLPVAVAVFLLGLWAHARFSDRWGFILAGTAIVTWALLMFGAKIGRTAFIKRLYASAIVEASGTWIAFAAIIGPLASRMPLALGIGAVALAVPWWTNRRRRAKVRVERTLAAWPDIAKAVGLAGSQVMSAVVDVWGWRARIRLARGQTIADVIAKIPALESGLGTFRGAVRIYPTRDDLANRCELRVLDRDPHADAIAWRGPSVTSITQPIDLGPFEDAEPCRVLFLRRHALLGGTTGAGKSGGLNVLLANLAACRDVVIWAIDLKKGMELKPWAPCIDRLATTPEEAAALLTDAVTILQARAQHLTDNGWREWEPSPHAPAMLIIVDEYAELAEASTDAMTATDTIARLGRAVAVTIVAATQRPTQQAMGKGAVRSQMNVRIAFRVRERRDVDLVLGQGMLSTGWSAHTLNAPGKFLVSAPEHDTPRRARAYLVTDQDVSAAVAQYAPTRPRLDSVSRRALVLRPPAQAVPDTPPPEEREDAGDLLWNALCAAPVEGYEIAELIRRTGMTRPTLYRRLREYAAEGRVIQVGRGHWRARTTEEPSL
jgi:hypothetical protein